MIRINAYSDGFRKEYLAAVKKNVSIRSLWRCGGFSEGREVAAGQAGREYRIDRMSVL